MNNVTKIVAALLVLLALMLGGYALMLARTPDVPVQAAATNPVSQAQFSVVVADKLLPAGTVIDPASLKIVALPINPTGSFTDIGALKGKIPKIDIGPGTPVVDATLAKGLTLQLKEGERAVAVSVDEVIGSGNRVTPGDMVDVFFTLKQSQDITKTQSRLLLSKLRVLTYGQESVDGPPPSEETLRNNGPVIPRTAVLAVPTADVNRLLLATQNGRLQLALRHPTDPTVPDLALFPEVPTVLAAKSTLTPEQRESLKSADNLAYAGNELGGLAGDGRSMPVRAVAAQQAAPRVAAPRPVAAPTPPLPRIQPPNTVEVVRGTQRETVGF